MFNVRLYLLFIGLSTCFCAQAQDTKEIKTTYQRIQKELHEYTNKTVPVFHMSVEGGETTGYYKNDTIQKLSTVLLVETGKWFQECYFKNEHLMFVLETYHRYNVPIYFDEELADEMGVTDVFDIEKTKITENRYYLRNDVIFKYLSDADATEAISLEGLHKKTQELVDDSKKL
ncbi:unnamed protein product, partial [Ectocarpus sp. 12 AP-2014]